MSKFKKEKVVNYIGKLDTVAVASYMPIQDICCIDGYIIEETLLYKIKTGFEVGIWRIKSLKNN